MVDEEDEIVIEILKQIQLVVDFKIDFKYTMNFLLKCSDIFNEEIQETIAKIYSGIGKMDQSILLSPVKEHFSPSPFYLQRILASKLIPKLYKTYPECAEIYKTLCEDKNVKVRIACAYHLKQHALYAYKDFVLLKKLTKDPCNAVKQPLIEILIKLFKD
jgi:hypothetical protein